MLWAEGFSIAAALLWGVNYPLVKNVLEEVPENDFLIIRFLFTGILFTAYLIMSGETTKIAKHHFIRVLVLGFICVGVYNIIWTYGIHRTTAANAAILISASPIFTGIYSQLFESEKISWSTWLGTLLAFCGICTIIYWTPGSEINFESSVFIGNILVLIGSILFSMYAILAKPLLRHYSPTKLTALSMILGSPVILIFSMTESHSLTLSYPVRIWLDFVYIVCFGTVIAFIFWYKGLQKTSAYRTVVFHYIVPVVSMVTSSYFFGENINMERIIGAFLVFTGILITKRKDTFVEQKESLSNDAS